MLLRAVCERNEYVWEILGALVSACTIFKKRRQTHTMMESHFKEWHVRKCSNEWRLVGPKVPWFYFSQ